MSYKRSKRRANNYIGYVTSRTPSTFYPDNYSWKLKKLRTVKASRKRRSWFRRPKRNKVIYGDYQEDPMRWLCDG